MFFPCFVQSFLLLKSWIPIFSNFQWKKSQKTLFFQMERKKCAKEGHVKKSGKKSQIKTLTHFRKNFEKILQHNLNVSIFSLVFI